MGFMDELKKLTQPYDDEEDFFEGADPSFKPKPKARPEPRIRPDQNQTVSAAQLAFENSFGDSSLIPDDEDEVPASRPGAQGGIFGGKGVKKPGRIKSPRERTMNLGGKDTSVILFSPKTFDEAGELVNYLNQDLTVVMTLEGVPGETARRLLDFLSGIAYALQGKITPVSAKTYFITSQNVDILGAQGQTEQPESAGHYF